uniref:DUF4203 domain-containing protein n=1 Tax=Heligmosomoides polygyrus TaxID=6339 RepID=A0A183F3U0_HELPZ
LSGCGSAVVFSASALLLAVCAFCHRTFICASTVLVTIAGKLFIFLLPNRSVRYSPSLLSLFLAILSTIGVSVFYAWANYQDNKVIKEDEDTIYEQILGWAFYCQIATTMAHWFASMLGCCVTSVSFSKTRAKLVKIEAIYRVDSHSLRQWERDYMRNAREQQQSSEVSSQEQYLLIEALRSNTSQTSFKRTSSMPNFSKKQRKAAQRKMAGKGNRELFSSTSNITDTTHTGKSSNLFKKEVLALRLKSSNCWLFALLVFLVAGSVNTLEMNRARGSAVFFGQGVENSQQPALPALPKLKSALKTPQQSRKSVNIDDSDVTYEYLPCDGSIGVSSFLGGRPPSSIRTYDPVYEQIGQESYLEPNSVRMKSTTNLNTDQTRKALLPTEPLPGSSQSIPTAHQKTTVINDVARLSSSVDMQRETDIRKQPVSGSRRTVEEVERMELFRRFPPKEEVIVLFKKPPTPPSLSVKPSAPNREAKPSLSIRNFGISLRPSHGYCDIGTTFDSAEAPKSSSPNRIKYSELEKVTGGNKPSAPSPLKYVSVERSSAERLRELMGRPSPSAEERVHLRSSSEAQAKTTTVNDSLDSSSIAGAGIAINTFGDRGRQRSITNLTFRPQSTTGASEVFERPDSMTLETSSVVSATARKPQPLQQMVHRKLLTTTPDEVDRSVGSSTMFENETMRDNTASYMRDAEVRLNLFMNDVVKDETTV